jgi:hypothetical protein
MTKHAILIAVAEHLDPAVRSVPYAERDLDQLSAAIEAMGVPREQQIRLVNQQATKSVVESKVRKLIHGLNGDDILYFYFVGHGFSLEERNFLTCHDTQDADRRDTSVPLEELFSGFHSDSGVRTVFFLDCFPRDHSELSNAISDGALSDLVRRLPNCICFTPCRADQIAHSSGKHRLSIWAHHLSEALQGNAPTALDQGKLTVGSLQDYLEKEVPRTLRLTTSDHDEQTPRLFTNQPVDQVLVDLKPILEKRRAAQSSQRIADVTFVISASEKIRNLSGWKKGLQVPDQFNNATNQFVASLAKVELKKDLDMVFGKLKEAFKFTRRDLDAAETLDGTGTITTPFFAYSVTVELDSKDLERVVWTRSVAAIRNPAQVSSKAFANVFDGIFNRLEFSLPSDLKVVDFIDAVEAAEAPGMEIRYDRECTYCELQLPNCDGTISVSPSSLSIVHARPEKVKSLIDSFENVIRLIGGQSTPLNALRTRAK